MFGFDKQTLNAINEYWNVVTDLYCTQIDLITRAQKSTIDVRSNMMTLCDQYIHQAMDYYGKIFSETMAKMNQKREN